MHLTLSYFNSFADVYACALCIFSRDLPRSSFFLLSIMAALFEGYTLCGLVPSQNFPCSGIQGVEAERDGDHVVVTDSTRSVTVYKVPSPRLLDMRDSCRCRGFSSDSQLSCFVKLRRCRERQHSLVVIQNLSFVLLYNALFIGSSFG